MQNAWNVQYVKDERLLVKVFEGDSPKASGAVEFAKKLKQQGLAVVDIISRRRAYSPPVGKEPPRPGMLWCPYCIKYREFEVASILHADTGLESPELLRCMTCTISVKDAYVRIYNAVFVDRHEIEQEMKKAQAPSKPILRRRRR